jgi:hypothetical protein
MPGYRSLSGPDNPAYFDGKSAETLGMNIGFVSKALRLLMPVGAKRREKIPKSARFPDKERTNYNPVIPIPFPTADWQTGDGSTDPGRTGRPADESRRPATG